MNILITGGSSSLAKAMAARRISMGDKVIITASSAKSLELTLNDYQQANLPVTGLVYDFSNPKASEADLELLSIDALILNAFGRVTRFRRFHELPYEKTLEYINCNINGNLWLIHYLLPKFIKQQFGRLVFISSISAINGTSRYAAYCAAKAAIEGLFLNLAVDYSAENILSNIVRVGIIKTERTRIFWQQESYQEKIASIVPQGCMGEPMQVAEALDPLLSKSSFITGSTLTVSGGLPLIRVTS